MKAFNSRKTAKEHWLFKFRGKKIYLTSKYGNSRKFKMKRCLKDRYFAFASTSFIDIRECFEQVNKVLSGTKNCSISTYIKNFERKHNLKIEDIGLTRKDFCCGMRDINKIANALKKYKEQKIKRGLKAVINALAEAVEKEKGEDKK